jgi:transposase-like protein
MGVIGNPDRQTVERVIGAHVAPGSTVVTDTHSGYSRLGSRGYVHRAVNHTKGDSVDKDGFSTNAVESIWALFKRQVNGTHHWISAKHTNAYLREMAFRLNRRELSKGEMVNSLLGRTEGPLPYKVLVA